IGVSSSYPRPESAWHSSGASARSAKPLAPRPAFSVINAHLGSKAPLTSPRTGFRPRPRYESGRLAAHPPRWSPSRYLPCRSHGADTEHGRPLATPATDTTWADANGWVGPRLPAVTEQAFLLGSGGADVGGLQVLRALGHLELHVLVLLEAAEAVAV